MKDDIVLWKQGDIVADYLEVGANYVRPLVAIEDIPDEVIVLAWQQANKVHGVIQWYVGGLYNITKGKYGGRAKRAKEIAEEHGFTGGTVAVYGSIDEAIEILMRIKNLSFNHHQIIAPLEVPDQKHWLHEAEVNDWSVSKLRNEIRKWQMEEELDATPELDIVDANIVLGDALDVDWPDNIDLILTDPPYGLTVESTSGVRAGKGDWDEFTYAELDLFNRAWIGKAKQSLKENGSLIVFGSLHNIFNIGHILKEMGFYIVRDIVWTKPFIQRQVNLYSLAPAHELIIWARKGDKHTCNLYEVTRDVWNMQPRTIFNHPTEKPEELAEKLLMMASNVNDLVVDPFCGSGTFPAVAYKFRRKYWAVERDERWWKIAQQRIGDSGL